MYTIKFDKMHGCGNDFIVWHDLINTIPIPISVIAQELCDRRVGVGADGMMVIAPARNKSALYSVTMPNSDGSMMSMCGNGLRCAVKYLVNHKLIPEGLINFSLEVATTGRLVECRLVEGGESININLGCVSTAPDIVPVNLRAPMVNYPLEIFGAEYLVSAVNIGNPYIAIFVDDLSKIDILKLGPAFENHVLFPKRTNVMFAKVIKPNYIEVKVWERGAGPTLSCASGSCAVVMLGATTGRCDSRAVVCSEGGELDICYDASSCSVSLAGPAVHVFSGNLWHV